MIQDNEILEEIQGMENVSIPYIQRKYRLNHSKSRQIQHKWVENERKEPIFDEKFQRYEENKHKERPIKIKKRFTRFFLNGKFFDTFQEFEQESNKKNNVRT